MIRPEFTYDNLVNFFGQDPTLDTVIRLLGDIEDQGNGTTSNSVGPLDVVDMAEIVGDRTGTVGINVTNKGIDLVDLTDPDNTYGIGSVRLFKSDELDFIRRCLESHLKTNALWLTRPTKKLLEHLINLL